MGEVTPKYYPSHSHTLVLCWTVTSINLIFNLGCQAGRLGNSGRDRVGAQESYSTGMRVRSLVAAEAGVLQTGSKCTRFNRSTGLLR